MTFDELLSTTQVGFGLNHVAIAVITGIRRRLKPSQCQLAEVYRQCCVSLCPSAQLAPRAARACCTVHACPL